MIILPSGLPSFLVTTKVFANKEEVEAELDPANYEDKVVFAIIDDNLTPLLSDGLAWIVQEVFE